MGVKGCRGRPRAGTTAMGKFVMAVDFIGESGFVLRIIGVSMCRQRQETGLCTPAGTGRTSQATANSRDPDAQGQVRALRIRVRTLGMDNFFSRCYKPCGTSCSHIKTLPIYDLSLQRNNLHHG
jgi:hypothetical protein